MWFVVFTSLCFLSAHSNGQIHQRNELMRRYVVEDDPAYKPAIFGSFMYDPLLERFNVLNGDGSGSGITFSTIYYSTHKPSPGMNISTLAGGIPLETPSQPQAPGESPPPGDTRNGKNEIQHLFDFRRQSGRMFRF